MNNGMRKDMTNLANEALKSLNFGKGPTNPDGDLTEDEVQKIKELLGNTIAVEIKLRGEK